MATLTQDDTATIPDAQPTTEAILTINGVRKSFGGNRAVDDCSFTVQRGTITGLIGPNGAGKTTLFDIVAGRIRPDRGEVTFNGTPITHRTPQERFQRGLMRTFQVPRPIPTLTVLENLVLTGSPASNERIWSGWFATRQGTRTESTVVDAALEVLGYVDLHHLRDAFAADLSGGQKKLLELARTLMVRPSLVLLDEPAAGVNRTLLGRLTALIERLRDEHGMTFLIIEHDMDLVSRLCRPVVVMSQGRLVCEGTPDEVRANPVVLDAYLGSQFR